MCIEIFDPLSQIWAYKVSINFGLFFFPFIIIIIIIIYFFFFLK